MITPNPFFPQFKPMRNYNNIHNVSNNFNQKPQTHYSPSPNTGGYKYRAYNNNVSNNLDCNSSTSTSNFPTVFNIGNEKSEEKQDKPIFEIFGIKLYFDDLLILALLFFLYKEECTDDSLFIILVLLLLS